MKLSGKCEALLEFKRYNEDYDDHKAWYGKRGTA